VGHSSPLSSEEEHIVPLSEERHENASGRSQHLLRPWTSSNPWDVETSLRARVQRVHLDVAQIARVPQPDLSVRHPAEL
jgi:hypothetical protein